MMQFRLLISTVGLVAVLPIGAVLQPQTVTAQTCQPPALSRLTRYTIAPGETLSSIANRYSLLPATLMGLNPSLRGGKATPGSQIVVPPFNGIRVEVPPGQTWRDVARTYKVRPDVLFEANGCRSISRVVFVPGVNWSPLGAANRPMSGQSATVLSGFPLSTTAAESTILLGYGYQLQSETGQVAFHSGIDLAASVGAPVLAAGAGTIAFAGTQGTYGNLVVINHSEGLQTRYAQLSSIRVKVGQRVSRGQVIAAVGTSGRPSSKQPHLHFEVRSRSNLGWVAENPAVVLQARE